MPRQRPAHLYSVHITAYASKEIKARVEAGEEYVTSPEKLTGELVYLGSSERLAAWHLYRACKIAKKNTLAYLVTLYKDGEKVIPVRIEHD